MRRTINRSVFSAVTALVFVAAFSVPWAEGGSQCSLSKTVGCPHAAKAASGCPAAAKKAEGGCCAKTAFENLKKLAGEWQARTDGSEKADGHVSYSVTANGSAVVETLFPGTPHEMMTVYHMDGDDLVLTHYCAAGNQPRMRLDRTQSKPDNLVFVFDGGTNLDPSKDMHMHSAHIVLVNDDAVESEWAYYEGGSQKGVHSFKLERVRKTAGLARDK